MKGKRGHIRWLLVAYDTVAFLAAFVLVLLIFAYEGMQLTTRAALIQLAITYVCTFICRSLLYVYRQMWRYGSIKSFARLMVADILALILCCVINAVRTAHHISAHAVVSILLLSSMCAVSMRVCYRLAFLYSSNSGFFGRLARFALFLIAGIRNAPKEFPDEQRRHIAILGAGRIGASLAEELLYNPQSTAVPYCFIERDPQKIGRIVHDVPVYANDDKVFDQLRDLGIDEVVMTIDAADQDGRRENYERFRHEGFRVTVYDFPVMYAPNKKRHIRDFDIEELLFRGSVEMTDDTVRQFYAGKTVMVTGGGGSIGSELCRQLAKMQPRKIIIADIGENGAYDVQQELRILYPNKVDVAIEIVSVCNRTALEQVFEKYHPDVVIHAAAHKHVPLMENNCVEAIANNVFGTLNTVELSEQYGVERFVMVSTDKAVNPTNVMGATKRMCEMIVLNHAMTSTHTTFTATRFGNVLGSAGSVVPLFKRQIQNGGPVTLTDKRIYRYFMTIPEASQLVLQSGSMAKNGELYVLDMGTPVKILDLAENMIRLAGREPYADIDIVETGLRPGEKLYEELLVDTTKMQKTANRLIFIEKDTPVTSAELADKLRLLREAVGSADNGKARDALKQAVPTFREPHEINDAVKEVETATV